MVNVRKRGNFYQYQFEVAPINGKRKQVTKSGFKTKAEAEKAGLIASGTSPDGELVEMVELPEHKYFIAGQFHPEFKSRPDKPAPLFVGLVKACIK